MASCHSKSQKISRSEIKFQQIDDETKLKLIQLNTGKWGFTNSDYKIIIAISKIVYINIIIFTCLVSFKFSS